MVQTELWHTSILHVSRLTDPASSGGGNRANLTVNSLPELIKHCRLRAEVTNLVADVLDATDFCRDWRNRVIAHRDLKLALEEATKAIEPVSLQQMTKALKSLAAVLNAISKHYLDSSTGFEHVNRHNGAMSLLRVLDEGVRAREEQLERVNAGTMTEADLKPREV